MIELRKQLQRAFFKNNAFWRRKRERGKKKHLIHFVRCEKLFTAKVRCPKSREDDAFKKWKMNTLQGITAYGECMPKSRQIWRELEVLMVLRWFLLTLSKLRFFENSFLFDFTYNSHISHNVKNIFILCNILVNMYDNNTIDFDVVSKCWRKFHPHTTRRTTNLSGCI